MRALADPHEPDLVSVIIPTYNRAHCLPRAMRSVLSQTHGNLELIVADDASTDGTEALVRTWDDARIVYVRQERNMGAGAARNLGLDHARGKLIAFQDSDDEWLLDKLERQIATLERAGPDTGAVFGSKLLYGRDQNYVYGPGRVSITPSAEYKAKTEVRTADLLRRSVISPQTLLVRSDAVAAAGRFDARLPCNEDWEWMLRLSAVTRIVFASDPVVVAYVQEDSIHRRQRGGALSFLIVMRKHRDLFARDPKAHSESLFRAGRLLHRTAKFRSSVICMRRAVRAAPRRPKLWLGLLHSGLSAVLR